MYTDLLATRTLECVCLGLYLLRAEGLKEVLLNDFVISGLPFLRCHFLWCGFNVLELS